MYAIQGEGKYAFGILASAVAAMHDVSACNQLLSSVEDMLF